MKYYDRVYVHDEDNGTEIKVSNTEWDTVSEKSDVIVLTIEELRQLWDAGWDKGYDDSAESDGRNVKNESFDFDNYLKSKGIDPTK